MTLANAVALMGSLLVLAIIPSVSVLLVSTRSASGGFGHGVATTGGIVLGDIVYICLAIFGLALLTEAMGEAAYLIKYAGGAYMIWMGIKLWRSADKAVGGGNGNPPESLVSSFMTGLFITLADQKVVLFYLGFLPAFIDLTNISFLDAGIVMAISVVAVGGVKLIYAYLAHKAGSRFGSGTNALINKSASCVMVGVGVYLFSK
jgi:threonine/homoserine/homoserine lactone efflux protein